MPTALAEAHVEAQRRLRAITAAAVGAAWSGLPGYDEQDVEPFLALAVPFVAAAQRQSVALANGYLARALGRQPLPIDPAEVTGDAVRAGVPAEERYRRPFIAVWSALGAGKQWEDAVGQGLDRATRLAGDDVQLAHRDALRTIGERDDRIQGYRRVANPGACKFCLTVSGAKTLAADPMPLHSGCGCSVEPITADFSPDPLPESVAVHDHGEFGPVLGDPAHAFSTL